jgi:hypothetical protein
VLRTWWPGWLISDSGPWRPSIACAGEVQQAGEAGAQLAADTVCTRVLGRLASHLPGTTFPNDPGLLPLSHTSSCHSRAARAFAAHLQVMELLGVVDGKHEEGAWPSCSARQGPAVGTAACAALAGRFYGAPSPQGGPASRVTSRGGGATG